ncbi:hypothetical protein SLE2022_000650 [Rubroshorea leprosula]
MSKFEEEECESKPKTKKEMQKQEPKEVGQDVEKEQKDRDEGLFCPGSPSFREYCCIQYDSDQENKNEGNINACMTMEEEEEDANSHKGTVQKSAKRRRMGKVFRRSGSAKVRSIPQGH